jgi:hypothetical protein
MNNSFFDILVAKEYETKQNGTLEKKTAWNRVGRAWSSKSGSSMSFEMFMFPGQRYVVQFEHQGEKALAQKE